MNVIQVQDLNKNYGKVTALSTLTFEIKKGEIFGIIGPDGAGKSTLFNILATLTIPTSGKVTILDKDILKDYKQIRKEIGYLPGTFSLYPDLTVQENLTFFATMYGSGIKDNLPMLMPIWKQIAPFKNREAGKLSGGMKQKLALCCALIHKPKILLLDEPTTGVDPVSRKEFWDLLDKIKEYDVTVIVSTPYMDEVTRCERVALMQEGKFITVDTPTHIMDQYKGHLYALKTTQLFKLLELMPLFEHKCSYYPYGEYLHISFYHDIETICSHFLLFLEYHQISFDHFGKIDPLLEDCFIELIQEEKDV
ncbi:MAG TPA: ABC transporter ATP-binding protein [Bacteroidales bacterium]|jgi:ABC-type multidrug transport system ATPase subunit|nr:ABC transporter ATP-binding protein [Bacteroidales bacterium]HPE41257.1 ABC transporter ATP-binding protein [Bacteroidales bacterium]